VAESVGLVPLYHMKAMIQPHAFQSIDTFTQDEFGRWLMELPGDDIHRYELLDGFIVREPPAGYPHSSVAIEIGYHLLGHVRAGKLGRVFESSQGFDLASGDTVEPDLSFVSNERWEVLAVPLRGFLEVTPNLIFEVLSPSTQRLDRTSKKRIYARNGVEEYVLVDSEARSFEQFHLVGASYGAPTTLVVGEVFESRVLPGFTLPVAEMFPSG
jgi:Uma2 family endonuclease